MCLDGQQGLVEKMLCSLSKSKNVANKEESKEEGKRGWGRTGYVV